MNFEIVAPQSHKKLASLVAHALGKKIIEPQVTRFADSELEIAFTHPDLLQNKIIFIIQSTDTPVHDNIMQFILLVHKVRAAGAQKIIGVMPYFGYSRHDSIGQQGKGSLELIARILKAAGVDEIITFEFHAHAHEKFFSIPVHNIPVLTTIADHIKKSITIEHACIISPDKGSQDIAQKLSSILGVDYMSFIKERYAPNKTRILHTVGHSDAKTAIIIDDMIDTGDTALNVCGELHKKGFTGIYGYFVHPVLSENAVQLIEYSYFDKIFVSNTIELQEPSEKIEQFDVSGLLVEEIKKLIEK